VDQVGYRVGDVLDIFSRTAHAPRMNVFINAALLGFIPSGVKKSLMALAPVGACAMPFWPTWGCLRTC
jgi:hypothetical protein